MKRKFFVPLFPGIFLFMAALSCDTTPVKAQRGEKAITAFSIVIPAVTGIIDENAKTISLLVPEGTNIRSLTAVFTITGVSVAVGPDIQVSGMTVNDFSSPMIYIVTAEDNSTAEYTVIVRVVSKKITSYAFSSITATGSIDESNKTITVPVPGNADVASLVATFVTTGETVTVGNSAQQSGITVNDFSNSVIYTVKGSDGSTANYTVTIMRSVSANWTTFDWTDTVTPPTGWLDRDGMNTYCTIANGILSFDSDSIQHQAHYRYDFSAPMDSGATMTLVLKARGDGAASTLAWMVDFQNRYRGQVEIRNGQVSLQNETSTIGTAATGASVMHTYMISYEAVTGGIRIKVYLDGASNAALAGTVSVATGNSFIRLGDLSKNNTYKGSLDWIIWTMDGAFFPGGVDMPDGFSLTP